MAAGAVAANLRTGGAGCGCIVGEGFGAVVGESLSGAAGGGADVGCGAVLAGAFDGRVAEWVL